MNEEETITLVAGGGAGAVVGYRYFTGKWPWEEFKPPEEPTPPGEGKLNVSNVNVDPKPVSGGESFNIIATVENTGQVEASGTISFTVEGGEVGSQNVTVPAGGSEEVSVSHSISQTGNYEVCAKVE